MNTIIMKTPNGSMQVYVGKFFPCSQARLRKLFRIMGQSEQPTYLSDVACALKCVLANRIQLRYDEYDWSRERYAQRMKEYIECGAMIASGKGSNGFPLAKQEVKDRRKEASAAKAYAERHRGRMRLIAREIKALEMNRKMLDEYILRT